MWSSLVSNGGMSRDEQHAGKQDLAGHVERPAAADKSALPCVKQHICNSFKSRSLINGEPLV